MYEAEKNFRSAVIFLGKFGFTADDVSRMVHAEVSAWIDSALQAQGMKPGATDGNTVHYHLARRKKPTTSSTPPKAAE